MDKVREALRRLGGRCPRCKGRLIPSAYDDDEISCLACGGIVYLNAPPPLLDEGPPKRQLAEKPAISPAA